MADQKGDLKAQYASYASVVEKIISGVAEKSQGCSHFELCFSRLECRLQAARGAMHRVWSPLCGQSDSGVCHRLVRRQRAFACAQSIFCFARALETMKKDGLENVRGETATVPNWIRNKVRSLCHCPQSLPSWLLSAALFDLAFIRAAWLHLICRRARGSCFRFHPAAPSARSPSSASDRFALGCFNSAQLGSSDSCAMHHASRTHGLLFASSLCMLIASLVFRVLERRQGESLRRS